MANRGPLYGLSKDCQIKAAKKFDIKQVREVLHWIEAVLGRKVHQDIDSLYSERDAASVLKNGVALCELMNAINPGSIRRINRQQTAFKQMENLELFTKACVEYGLRQLDVFQIADLFEAKAVYTVFNCLHALGSLAQKNSFTGPNYGVRISEKKERHFSTEQIAKGKMIIPMQAGTNVVPSQAGMSPYGFSRQIVPSDNEQTIVPPSSTGVISLQYGTNSMGSQKGMTPYGLGRQITLSQSDDQPVFESANSDSKKTTEADELHESSSLDRGVGEEKDSNGLDFPAGDIASNCNVEDKTSQENGNNGNNIIESVVESVSHEITDANGADENSGDDGGCHQNGVEIEVEILVKKDSIPDIGSEKEVNGNSGGCDATPVNGSS